jgi:hypothetical protein
MSGAMPLTCQRLANQTGLMGKVTYGAAMYKPNIVANYFQGEYARNLLLMLWRGHVFYRKIAKLNLQFISC